jgi:hypothetical protein
VYVLMLKTLEQKSSRREARHSTFYVAAPYILP